MGLILWMQFYRSPSCFLQRRGSLLRRLIERKLLVPIVLLISCQHPRKENLTTMNELEESLFSRGRTSCSFKGCCDKAFPTRPQSEQSWKSIFLCQSFSRGLRLRLFKFHASLENLPPPHIPACHCGQEATSGRKTVQSPTPKC